MSRFHKWGQRSPEQIEREKQLAKERAQLEAQYGPLSDAEFNQRYVKPNYDTRTLYEQQTAGKFQPKIVDYRSRRQKQIDAMQQQLEDKYKLRNRDGSFKSSQQSVLDHLKELEGQEKADLENEAAKANHFEKYKGEIEWLDKLLAEENLTRNSDEKLRQRIREAKQQVSTLGMDESFYAEQKEFITGVLDERESNRIQSLTSERDALQKRMAEIDGQLPLSLNTAENPLAEDTQEASEASDFVRLQVDRQLPLRRQIGDLLHEAFMNDLPIEDRRAMMDAQQALKGGNEIPAMDCVNRYSEPLAS